MTTVLSREEGRKLLGGQPTKKSKYNAHGYRDADGLYWASAHEAQQWAILKIREKAGKIKDLKRQVPFKLIAQGGAIIGRIVMDFVCTDTVSNKMEFLDAKGFRTDLYLWKRKHFENQYRTKIIEL